MSSSKLIIVAINDETGEAIFPLDDVTLYDQASAENILSSVREQYSENYSISIYGPQGFYAGNMTSD